MIPSWLFILGVILVIMMVVYGILFFIRPKLALELTGHTEAGAVEIVGARFFFFAALGGGFLYMQNWSAMVYLLALGSLVAILDAVLEKRHGGAVWPHAVVAVVAAILAYLFHTFSMTGSL